MNGFCLQGLGRRPRPSQRLNPALSMWIATTTVSRREDGERLAAESVAQGLAVCAQVEGPISSHYVWQGKVTTAEEWRVTFKCLAETVSALSVQVHASHPYETPQWIVIEVAHVGEKYLSWAQAPRTSVNF